MIIWTMIMLVLFFNIMGFVFRIGWGITKWVFSLIGWLVITGLVVSFAGIFLLPAAAVIFLIIMACSANRA